MKVQKLPSDRFITEDIVALLDFLLKEHLISRQAQPISSVALSCTSGLQGEGALMPEAIIFSYRGGREQTITVPQKEDTLRIRLK